MSTTNAREGLQKKIQIVVEENGKNKKEIKLS
jgi:hypothetical protein